MMIRIPLSIKVDTESEVYKNLIKPKRESREITGFVVELFELYYENDEVKELLAEHLTENNPYTEMQERLMEINKKHERNVTNRTFISQYTEVEKEKADAEYRRKQSEGDVGDVGDVAEDVVSEEGIESLVEKLLPKLQEALVNPVEEKDDKEEKESLKREIARLRAEKEAKRVENKEGKEGKAVEDVREDVARDVAPKIPEVEDETLFEVEKTETRQPKQPRVSSAFAKMSSSL